MSFWSLRKRLIAATVCTVCLLALVSLMFSDTRRISPTAAVKMPQVVRGNSTYHFPANNDSFTMTEILELCHSRSHENVALTITQRYALEAPLDAIRDDYLNTCHPIEISTSQGARSMGHCSDFAQYIYYGNARLSSDQYEASTFTLKTSKCSQSMYLHGEYLIWQILESKHKVKNLWMPNLEQVTANDLKHVENMDLILCKTKVTCEAFDALLKEKALPKSPKTYLHVAFHSGYISKCLWNI
ncbi:hypothetical protein BDR26DRAFT_904485 [Obelidium mucronatum]|nr:hypothetical protein BDR26DRAFT_904485 [Obelidium mucronatum]